jgi:uncharacterized protein (DUF2235 family)
MAKRLVVCCDGTWNTLDQRYPTNVSEVFHAVAPAAGNMVQKKHYVEGVGNKPWQRLTGGAFGAGLSDNVKDAYRFVVEHYEPGDELFFFGFSRGAYTARSTVGFIRNCGILLPRNKNRIDEAYEFYRDRDDRSGPDGTAARDFRARHAHPDPTPIRFIGVWDTVGSLGIPLSGGRLLNRFNRRWQFHDTKLSSTVQSAFHALAIDEKRPSFAPTIWDPSPTGIGLERSQLWFAGDHSDVGGGYGERGLSNVALRWLVTCARSCGLAFTPNAFAELAPNPLGTVHTMQAVFRVLGTLDRPIGMTDPDDESVSSSAEDRTTAGLTPPYNPTNLRAYLGHRRRRVTPVPNA